MSKATGMYLAAWLASWLGMDAMPAAAQALSYSTNAKVSAADIIWQRRHPIATTAGEPQRRFEGADDCLRGIAVDADGSVYATGYCFNGTNFDCITWKCDRGGNLLWERRHDDGGNDAGNGVALDAEGNAYVAGFTSSDAHDDFLVLKYGAAGNVLWRQTYDSGGNDWACGAAADLKGDVYVTGTCWNASQEWIRLEGNANAGCGPPGRCTKGEDWTTLKYDSTGKLLWRRSAAGFGAAVAVGGAEHVCAIGDEGGAIRTYDPDGRLLWQKESQLAEADWGWGASLAVTMDAQGNAYVTGIVSSRATNDLDRFLVKYRPDGGAVWKRTFHDWGNDSGVAVALDGEDQVYLAINDCLVKCDSHGSLVWSKHLGWNGLAMACDAEGNILVCAILEDAAQAHHDLVIAKVRKQ
ncbi:MAG: NHL repeat-containing protein [Pirellulaceae bacterium]